MQKSNKKKIEEFIRVDHAGERGAIKIYEGQLLALSTIVKNEELKKTIEHMKEHEVEHCEFFEKEIKKRGIEPTKFLPLWDLLGLGLGFGSTLLGKKAAMLCTASVEEVIDEHYLNQIKEIKKRNIKPTRLLPLWDLLGVGLGFGSTLLGKKAAMLCTASVEEVIDEHYLNQIKQLDKSEPKLKKKIIKFREDELSHKDIAYEKGATKEGPYSILDKIIKTGSKIAINISEKI